MAIQLGSAYGKVEIDSSGVTKGLKNAETSMNSLSEKAKRMGATMQSVGKAMTLAFSVPIALMAKDAVMAASSYEESLNKVNVVFQKNGAEIKKWSEDAAKKLGMTQQQVLEASATFGNLFDTIGLGEEENAKMSMSLVQLATDLASLHNISPEEALMKLRSGLVGEVEPLRTVGVLLNETAVKAKALEMGLMGSNGELSEAAKVQARYALILEQTTNAQGDFARTSGSLANQLRTLKANWGDTLRILGDQLLPIVTKVLIKLNEFLEWFNNAPPQMQKLVGAILLLVFVAGPLLVVFGKLLPLVFAGATKSLNPFSGGIFGLIATILKWISVAAIAVKVLTFFGVATGPVGAAIVGLQAAIAGVGVSIMSVLGPILLIVGAVALLYWAFSTNFMGITDTAKQLWFVLGYYFAEGWKMLVNSVQNGATMVLNWFKTLGQKIMTTIRAVNWQQIGKYLLMGIANGMTMGIPLIVAAAIKAAKAALDAIKRTLGIKSPSTEFMKLGAFSGKGFQMGLEKMMDPATIAKTMAKPSNSFVSSSQNSYTMQFSNGLTLKDVDRLMEQKLGSFTRQLNKAVGA